MGQVLHGSATSLTSLGLVVEVEQEIHLLVGG